MHLPLNPAAATSKQEHENNAPTLHSIIFLITRQRPSVNKLTIGAWSFIQLDA
jgi:hypothetical protein